MEEVNTNQLKSFVERIERLEEEKDNLVNNIKEVYMEAKVNGFDTKILRKVVLFRSIDKSKRLEEETLLDLYLRALGVEWK